MKWAWLIETGRRRAGDVKVSSPLPLDILPKQLAQRTTHSPVTVHGGFPHPFGIISVTIARESK
jgi:hypothetical protein